MENKDKQIEKGSVFSKHKFLIISILTLELLFVFRGPRLYGVLIFMITIAILLILGDKEENPKTEDKISLLKSSILNEIELIEKSTDKLNYKLTSKEKLKSIMEHTEKITEKYYFIKKNYGKDRANETLDMLLKDLEELEKNLKKVNDNLLNLYVTEESDKELNEDLEYIINQIEARGKL